MNVATDPAETEATMSKFDACVCRAICGSCTRVTRPIPDVAVEVVSTPGVNTDLCIEGHNGRVCPWSTSQLRRAIESAVGELHK